MKLKAFNVLVLLSVVLGIAACGQKPDPSITERISSLMEFYEESGQFSGVILVAQDGKILYEDAFGWANLEWRIPNALDTRFRIASITKDFTKVLIMQQVEAGRLQLNGRVSDYLPDYPEGNGERITIHHLLTHSAGIIDYEHIFMYMMLGDSVNIGGFTLQIADPETVPDFLNAGRLPHTREEILGHFADKELLFNPGTGNQYSNFGYNLLAMILEQVTGQPYSELLQEGILDPAGMENTGMDVNNSILERRASGYYSRPLTGLENSPYIDMSLALGSGCLYSTAEDLFLFYEALYSGQLLSDDTQDRLINSGYMGDHVAYPYDNGPLEAVGGTGAINGFNNSVQRLTGGNGVQFVVVMGNYRNSEAQVGVVWPVTIGRQIAAIINDLEYEFPTISAASIVGQAALDSGGEAASAMMTDLYEQERSAYRFEAMEFLLVANRLVELNKYDEACQVIQSYIREFPETPEIQQKLADYCE